MPIPGDVDRSVDGHRVRRELQALRAVAVTLVVVYHLEPRLLPGGYVGVDVFFVVSGFLITLHISRGLAADAPFSLLGFYARRIRRLLPASLTVLLVVGVVTLVAVPQTLWNTIGRELVSAAFYVENWTLASTSVDYLAAGSHASPVQHFWSLSVEEQFYALWPLLLLAASVLGARHGRARGAVIGVVATITVLSLAYSVHQTQQSPSWAYFVTPTRAWEFGLGGLVALTVPVLRAPAWARSALSWTGLAAIAGSAVLLSGETPFPGFIALFPVLGAIAVIMSGDVPGRHSPSRIGDLRPVQFIGDISYSVYLWHWPLIVLVPVLVGGPSYELPIPLRVAVVAAAIPIAWLSKKYVEDPFRGGGPRRDASRAAVPRGTRQVLVGAVAGMLVVGGVGGVAFGVSQARIDSAQAELTRFTAADLPCVGAASLEPGCAGRTPDGVVPNPMIATRDATEQTCQQAAARAEVIRCEYGSDAPSSTRVALVGDSHANQWMPALSRIAQDRGWRLVTYVKSGCAYAVGLGSANCQAFNREVAERLRSESPDVVITSARSGLGYGSHADTADAVRGFAAAWEPLIAAGTRVYALADTPEPEKAGLSDPPSCVAGGETCTISEARALPDDALVRAAERTGATVVDLRDSFCFDGRCPAVIGGVLVYRDSNHITSVYARSLSTVLGRHLEG